jgi:folate-binding Fe-S cluster repair protein YgfZ
MFIAQMLNLDLIDGISFTKGCFTGQEIIARTQHLGRIKRRLYRLRLPAGTWAIGQTVHLTDGRGGRLTELAQTGSEFEALAVLNTEANTPGVTAGAEAGAEAATSALIDATELPLPYSLSSPN